MSRFDIDWTYLRRFTPIPLASTVIAITALCVSVWMHGSEKQLYLQLTANRSAVHENYDTLVEQRRIVDRYHRRYQRFYDLGFIGRESRLDLVETMRLASAETKLPRLSYSIEPQLAVVAPVTSILGGDAIQVRVSKLRVDMGLLHELDLLRFFDALQNQAPGLLSVDRCDLEHVGAERDGLADTTLTASCEVRVFSVITSDIQGETA